MDEKKIYDKGEYTVGVGTPLTPFVNNSHIEYATYCLDDNIPKGIVLGIKRCREGVLMPRKVKGNAGIDLRVLTEDGKAITLNPNECKKFFTGIKMDIPEGYYLEVVPRSSTGITKCLRLMNTCGILDSSWKGETIVALHNFGKEPVTIENNDRVCQMILHRDLDVAIKEVNDVGSSARGENGIGSSGDK